MLIGSAFPPQGFGRIKCGSTREQRQRRIQPSFYRHRAGANALFRALDRDGDWRLSKIERRSCQEVIASLDLDSNGTLEASELPILMRVCIGRGASAHKPLLEAVSIVNQSDRVDQAKRKNLAPQWFVSMDEDGDLNLTREEFLGNRESFNKIDTNENERLSVEEVLATKLE